MNTIKSVNDLKFSNRNETIGKFGEQKAKEFFDLKGFSYKDVSDDYEYQVIDVDFLVDINGNDEMLETKTFKDMIINKNQLMIKYETEYIDEELKQKKGNDAWLYRTKAKYIMFVCKASSQIIIITTDALKEYIDKFKDTKFIRKQRFFDEDEEAGGKYDRYNSVYYISIKHLASQVNANGRERIKIYTDLMN